MRTPRALLYQAPLRCAAVPQAQRKKKRKKSRNFFEPGELPPKHTSPHTPPMGPRLSRGKSWAKFAPPRHLWRVKWLLFSAAQFFVFS